MAPVSPAQAPLTTLETASQDLAEFFMSQLKPGEHLSLEVMGENSQFLRFNHARVRQTGTVEDGSMTLKYSCHDRTAESTIPFTGDRHRDQKVAVDVLELLRQETPQLPVDPYVVLPKNYGSSHEIYDGQLLPEDQVVEALLTEAADLDLTGIYSAGMIFRGHYNSAGQRHWFATTTFCFDYSLFTATGKAVKATLAGSQWQPERYTTQLQRGRHQLRQLEQPAKILAPGRYRTYFAPPATAELLGMLSWGAVSESSFRQGQSALANLHQGQRLSPLITLQENFSQGTVPRFNAEGEIAPMKLAMIDQGNLNTFLINRRTAQEYQLVSNGANGSESLRSPELLPGTLTSQDIFTALDTGLYLSNLHYLNWSDRPKGSMTGMTRYACFWVEKGEIIAPIQDLRFDDSLYRFWGDNLIHLTQETEWIPNTDTYEHRSLGGSLVPGMLVADFNFTL